MSTGDEGLLRNVTREVLAELLPGLLEEARAAETSNGNGNGHRTRPPVVPAAEVDAVVPQVPAPPIARVHRPSGWVPQAPPTPEGSAENPPPPAVPGGVTTERATLRNDADLDAFVRMLIRRVENPRERRAILAGEVRFQLAGSPGAPATSAPAMLAMRVETGAVTERTVQEAARSGARLVLSSRAVLTPMARDRARSLGVEIEKEKPC